MSKVLLAVATICILLWCGNAAGAIIDYWSCDPANDTPGGLGDSYGGYTAAPTGSSTNPPVRIAGATGIADSAVKIYGASGGGTGGYKTTLLNLGTVFTWEMMVRFDAYAYRWAYFTDRAGGPITVSAGNSAVGWAFNPSVDAVGATGNTWQPTLGQWWLLAIVGDGTTAKLYATPQGTANQILEVSWACSVPASHATQGLSIGCCDGSRYGANGYVDWVAVSNTALTPEELSTHNLNNTPIPEPATMALLALGSLAILRRRR